MLDEFHWFICAGAHSHTERNPFTHWYIVQALAEIINGNKIMRRDNP